MMHIQLYSFGKYRGLWNLQALFVFWNKVPHLNVKPHFHRGRVSKQLPGAWLMRIQMSCRFLKTVNLTVITVVALAPGVCWLGDVRKKYRHLQTPTKVHVLSFKTPNNGIKSAVNVYRNKLRFSFIQTAPVQWFRDQRGMWAVWR